MTAQPTPSHHGQGENFADESPLAALIDQLRQNWDSGDNAANDDLVVRIRELIRCQRESVAPDDPAGPPVRPEPTEGDAAVGPDASEGTDDQAPVGVGSGAGAPPPHAEAVIDDVEYWSHQGVQVVSIRCRGEGAVIGVRRLTDHIVAAMQRRYDFPVYCWDAPAPGPLSP